MSSTTRERMGPVVLISRDRRLSDEVRELLRAERFDLLTFREGGVALEKAERLAPTVVLVDWALDDAAGCEELVYRLRPRRTGPRVIVIAGAGGAAPADATGVRAVLDRALDPEELVDLVWRHHHEVIDARKIE